MSNLRQDIISISNLIILKHIPNTISILRALSTFLIGYALSIDESFWQWFAQALFIVAVLSDFLDGYLARKFDAVSALGKVLDASVDKLFFFGLLFFFVFNDIFSLTSIGLFLILHIIRDIAVTAIRCNLLKKGIAVNVLSMGQIKTAFQFVFLFLGMLISLLEFQLTQGMISIGDWIEKLTTLAYYIYGFSIILSLVSGYSYLKFFYIHHGNKV